MHRAQKQLFLHVKCWQSCYLYAMRCLLEMSTGDVRRLIDACFVSISTDCFESKDFVWASVVMYSRAALGLSIPYLFDEIVPGMIF